MEFLYNLMQSWWFWAAYLLVFSWTVYRVVSALKETQLYEEAFYYEVRLRRRRVHPFRWLAIAMVFFLGYALAPLWTALIAFAWWDNRKERLRLEKERAERERIAYERIRRAEAWKKQNQPTVYYKTENNITVAIRGSDYPAAVENTLRGKHDGWWPQDASCLAPYPDSFLLVRPGTILYPPEPAEVSQIYYISGVPSDLFVGLAKHAKLEPMDQLFIPFLNESLMSFESQRKRISKTGNASMHLLDQVVPEEVLNGTVEPEKISA